MALEIGEAVSLFSTLFQLSMWAVGFIAIAYMLATLRVFGQRVRQIKLFRRR